MMQLAASTETGRMTTLQDRSGHEGASAQDDAHCPHCGRHMHSGVELPWPPEPALCSGCHRWVGRGRAISAAEASARHGVVAAAAPSDQGTPGERGTRPGRRPSRPGSPERRRERELSGAERSPSSGPSEGAANGAEPDAPASGLVGDDAPLGAGAPEPAATETFSPGGRVGAEAPPAEGETFVGPGDGAHAPGDVHADGAAAVGPAAEPVVSGNGAVTEAPFDGDGLAAPAHERVGPEAPAQAHAQAAAPEQAAPHVQPAGAAAAQEDATSPPGHAAPYEHTMPFPVAPTEEPKRLRRLPFLRRRTPSSAQPATTPPSGRSRLMRALPITLVAIGVLLLAEAAVTVLWKEPISALLTARGQSALGNDLEKMEREASAEAAKNRAQMVKYQQQAAVKLKRSADPGDPLGRLRIPKTGLNMVVVQSTDEASLQKGPAHYTETPLPGQKGNWTVGIAGHRTTYEAPFRHNDNLKRGNKIFFTLPYGRFTYEVTKTRIVDAGYKKAFVPQGRDMLVLTACHPLYSAAQRILVYGKLVKTEARGKAKKVAQG